MVEEVGLEARAETSAGRPIKEHGTVGPRPWRVPFALTMMSLPLLRNRLEAEDTDLELFRPLQVAHSKRQMVQTASLDGHY